MNRIPMVDTITMSEKQKKVFDDIVSGPRGRLVGPLRVVLHNPDLADVWQQFGASLRYFTSVPRKLSELAILVTARRWNSPVEWCVHSVEAQKAGLSAEVINELGKGMLPEFDSREEALVYEFVRSMQETGQVSDFVYEMVREFLGESGIMELSSISGYYTLVAVTLNVHAVPLPEGVVEAVLPEINEGAGLTCLPPLDLDQN